MTPSTRRRSFAVMTFCLAVLSGCMGSGAPQAGRPTVSGMSCPNLSVTSQQYMHGQPGTPVRCGAQFRSPSNSAL